MPVEFIGLIGTREASEIIPAKGPIFDIPWVEKIARAHEKADFDRCLIGHFAGWPDGFLVAAQAFFATEKLGILLAHRPGFMQPALAARKLATLDQMSHGRLAVHIITGGDDADQQRDGDYLGKDDRYRRTDEYLEVMKKVWTETKPFDHEGEFYKYTGAYAEIRCYQQPHIPIYFGGASDAALRVAGKHAETYALFGEPLDAVQEELELVRASAAKHGRTVRFSVSTRPIVAETEEKAWERAFKIREIMEKARGGVPSKPNAATGGARLLAAADRGEILDKRLWTPLARLSGARGNSTALVGDPEQVADSLLDYYDLGVRTLLIRGYDPLDDCEVYTEVIRIVRAEVAKRDRAADTLTPTLSLREKE